MKKPPWSVELFEDYARFERMMRARSLPGITYVTANAKTTDNGHATDYLREFYLRVIADGKEFKPRVLSYFQNLSLRHLRVLGGSAVGVPVNEVHRRDAEYAEVAQRVVT